MRIETQISKGYSQVQYVGLTRSENILLKDMVSELTSIADRLVGEMLDNEMFKEQTQEVADFINAIIDEICDTLLAFRSNPANHEEEMILMTNENKRRENQWRVVVEKHLITIKAKAAGFSVSSQEVDTFMSEEGYMTLLQEV